jgi:asparagine synthase (glutamine-hydrolysing)
MVPGPRGVFRGVERLEPAEYVLFQRGGSRRGRYWTPRYEETARASLSELAEEYRARMRAAVRSCLASANGKIGAFLSGGTDSSTIVGVLREIAGEPPEAYSIGFAIEGFDESSYARIAASHFGARHHTYQVTPKDVEASLPSIAEAYDVPFGNASAVASYHCALLARSDGIGTLLGGDGGDEIFAGNSRYAKQAVFDRYLRLPAALRKSLVEPILGALPANGFLPLRPLSKARSFIRQANIPLPDRLEEYNFVTRMTPEAIFTGDFLSSVRPDEPLQLLRDSYAEADTRSTLNRLLYIDLKFTLADNDLRKVGGTCELAGVDVLYPFLDRDLVEFANRLPPGLKLKGRKLRYFFKYASRGFLPEAILTKQKHGFGIPCGRWLRDHAPLRDLAYDSLRSLEKRGYLRSEFVSRLMALHQGDHPDYYGVMVYVLTMLELWHRKHAP